MAKLKAPKIRYSTYIRAPQARVFRTLTTARGWDAWFTTGMKLDARPGGRILFRWKNFGPDHATLEDGGPVLVVEPPRRFVFQWAPRGLRTTVAFTLERRGRGTVVRVVESGYPMTRRGLSTLVMCAGGWGEALTLLKFYLERGATYGRVPRARR